ncbi:MAG: LacI family DNA-binding transcriptional regulator [bacterium]|jgi:LacI family sucrose operon transcriptional repressor
MPFSLKEIARLAGVSKTTVSMVVNGRGEHYRISADTQQRVLKLVEEHGYAPNAQARSLRLRRTHTLGLVVPDLLNRFFAEFAQAFDSQARDQGYQVFLTATRDDLQTEVEVLQTLLSRNVDGLVIASVDSGGRWKPSAKYLEVPRVYIDRVVNRPEASWVVSDDYTGTLKLVEELCRRGCQEVFYFGGESRITTSQHRLAGFRDALKAHGVRFVRQQVLEWGYGESDGFSMAQEVHSLLQRPPEAVFVGAFTLFEGVLRFMREQAPEWLEQTHFATFDDHPILDYLPSGVPSIRQNAQEMASQALKMLLQQISGNRDIQQVRIPTQLCLR